MKSKIIIIAIAIAIAITIVGMQNMYVYAGGPEYDYDEEKYATMNLQLVVEMQDMTTGRMDPSIMISTVNVVIYTMMPL